MTVKPTMKKYIHICTVSICYSAYTYVRAYVYKSIRGIHDLVNKMRIEGVICALRFLPFVCFLATAERKLRSKS